MPDNSDKLEPLVERLETLIQEKLLDCQEFHDICNEMKDQEYHVDMGILALLIDYKKAEKGFISFPFYLDFKDKNKKDFDLSKNDKKFLKDLGISL